MKLSGFYSDDMKKHAEVIGENGKYFVVFKDDFGSSYNVEFESEQAAEDYAEEWVKK